MDAAYGAIISECCNHIANVTGSQNSGSLVDDQPAGLLLLSPAAAKPRLCACQ
jgi:hypothetical protein